MVLFTQSPLFSAWKTVRYLRRLSRYFRREYAQARKGGGDVKVSVFVRCSWRTIALIQERQNQGVNPVQGSLLFPVKR